MAEEGKGKIEKFNGMNFQWWKMQVEDYLYQKDLYLPLVGEKPEAMNAMSNSTISGTLTLNDVVSSVMNDEIRRKTIGDGISSSTALSVKSRGRQNNKQNNRGRSPTRGRSRSRGKSKSKGKTIVCWNCNKEGHKKNDCTEPKKKKGAGGRQSDDKGANMVSSNERTYDDLCLSATVDDNSKVWYVDSGASIHCTPHRDCFSNYVHGDYGHVTVGNGYRCSIVGKGKVEIKLSNGGTLVLKDVRHIPELQKNLISVSELDREGYFVAFGEKQWKVTKGSMVVARGERVRTLYTLSGTHNHSISLAFKENQRTTLWHHRLGHLSESGMKILHSKNALPGMKNIQLDFWEGCVYGKQKRVSFRRDGKEKKIERLELVHTDVCGPTTVKSLGGNKVKCLKSDNGDEYRDGGFQEYCSNNGIRLIRTVKRTPQENGLAERMNRTIMERARCMRIHVDLPLQFWAPAVDTAVYLINRSPTSALNGGIPEEEWSGKPVNYSFLRVFGCIAYAHIDKEERKKLDSKSQKCVFIGYGGDEYGYRLWDYKHNKISGVGMSYSMNYGCISTGYKNMELKKTTGNTWNLMSQKMDRYPGQKIQKSLMRQLILKLEPVINNKCLKLLTLEEVVGQSAIHLAKNSAFHSRTKHIQLRYHFIRSLLEDEQLTLEKIEGNKNPADMLTKSFPADVCGGGQRRSSAVVPVAPAMAGLVR
ncbi:hypothetical protein RJ639_005486 [Escallonia herrerae]|uniref:Uncharacterized protein n=1 Tax=Escallonia herrerae TaxID=1293975 RepID=A0AA88W137_9ASTE|nr:hypothetical protein RJ639_005486 [Escallonia herrerae]